MDFQTLLIIQAIADVVLGAAIVFLLMQLAKSRHLHPAIYEANLRQLREALHESEQHGQRFLAELAQARQALEETLRRAEGTMQTLNVAAAAKGKADIMDGKDYGGIAAMVGAGMTEQEIAARSGLPEGEIKVISDLLRARHGRT
jgi:hypothetical protein